jgi:hypothetical protein
MTSVNRAPAPVHAHTYRPYEERAVRYATAADRLTTGGLCTSTRIKRPLSCARPSRG